VAGTGVWFLGALAVVTALYALFQAAHAHGQGVYLGGLVYAAFAVLFVLGLIRRSYDKHDAGH
jgi:hypothetical protein